MESLRQCGKHISPGRASPRTSALARSSGGPMESQNLAGEVAARRLRRVRVKPHQKSVRLQPARRRELPNQQSRKKHGADRWRRAGGSGAGADGERRCRSGISGGHRAGRQAKTTKGGKFKKRLGKTSFWKIRVLLNLAPKGVGFATPVDKNASGDDFGCWRALTGTPFAAI